MALAIVDRLDLEGYHAFHATRAELLRRVGRSAESQVAYDRAIELADNAAEIALLTHRSDQLSGDEVVGGCSSAGGAARGHRSAPTPIDRRIHG